MDPQIEELKQLMRQNIALTTETNKILRGMRSASRLKSILWSSLLLVSIGASVYSYYYYVAPRIEQIKTFYQKDIAPLRESGGITQFFQKMFAQQAAQQSQTVNNTDPDAR